MPKSDSSNSNDGPNFPAPRYRPNWIVALIYFFAGVFLLVALFTYDPLQSSFHTTAPTLKNPTGRGGANAVWVLLFTIGWSTWLVPAFSLFMLWVSVRNSKHLTGTRTIAIVVACVAASCPMP